jgi:bifunctional DNA-binding transcriptional regulator/antitoxin component of YhaV-PrlF toxin-antitoxin module
MASAKVTSKGQITIPVEVRTELNPKLGDPIFSPEIQTGDTLYAPTVWFH